MPATTISCVSPEAKGSGLKMGSNDVVMEVPQWEFAACHHAAGGLFLLYHFSSGHFGVVILPLDIVRDIIIWQSFLILHSLHILAIACNCSRIP